MLPYKPLQIRTIDRGIEIPHEGAFCGEFTKFSLCFSYHFFLSAVDLVWSDPEEIAGWAISPRGAGYLFGASVTQEVSDCESICLIDPLISGNLG